jgi:hypothetical protein
MNLQELLNDVKNRTATTDSSSKFLGKSIYTRIQNFLQQGEKFIIKNAHFPIGSEEKVQELQNIFEQKFGFPLPNELASFYEIFDGFELHTQDLSPNTTRHLLQENDWILNDYNLTLDFADLSISEWRTGTNRGGLEELKYLVGLHNMDDFEDVGGPLTSAIANDYAYYGDITHEIAKEGSCSTIIPNATRLFSDGNKAGEVDGIQLYYFDVFSSFYQIVIGIKDKKVALYQANYGYGDLTRIKENIPTYLKKIIVRGIQ